MSELLSLKIEPGTTETTVRAVGDIDIETARACEGAWSPSTGTWSWTCRGRVPGLDAMSVLIADHKNRVVPATLSSSPDRHRWRCATSRSPASTAYSTSTVTRPHPDAANANYEGLRPSPLSVKDRGDPRSAGIPAWDDRYLPTTRRYDRGRHRLDGRQASALRLPSPDQAGTDPAERGSLEVDRSAHRVPVPT